LAETTLAENEERYVAAVSARCHRCTALSQLQDKVQERPHASALLLSATLRPPPVDVQDGGGE
jgi:Rad3-related DNA helicase